MLKPKITKSRKLISLDGLWEFKLDLKQVGMLEGWFINLSDSRPIAVPSSYNDLFTEPWIRDFVGDVWYQKDFEINLIDEKVFLHFGSVTLRATVWLNGILLGDHEGGYLPFEFDITNELNNGKNKVIVKVNNELSYHSLPIGKVETFKDGSKYHYPAFDFFNYAGIHRSVSIYTTPENRITDVVLVPSYDQEFGFIDYEISGTNQPLETRIHVFDDGVKIAESTGIKGKIKINQFILWSPDNPYLYDVEIQYGTDFYHLKTGIRTVQIKGNKFLLNGEPIYFKGFGKHDDFEIIGKGFNYPVMIRDFELLKWIGANSVRTTHYPYAEEFYELADRYGILVIDEVPAVGMWKRQMDLSVMGNSPFFAEKDVMTKTMENHKSQLKELVNRDKNHPSVVIWSVANEPASDELESEAYFKEIFEYAKTLDPEQRPIGFVNCGVAPSEKCKVSQFGDILMLNRYTGWYYLYGSQFPQAKQSLVSEMTNWTKMYDKPIIMTEYGADAISGMHQLPSVMFSEEYQVELLKMYHEVFDQFDQIIGEHPWNFADFNTEQGLNRVLGNKKGIFTRNRQPKMVAQILRNRWLNIK